MRKKDSQVSSVICHFWDLQLSVKAARKMLVKLTPGRVRAGDAKLEYFNVFV